MFVNEFICYDPASKWFKQARVIRTGF